MYNVIDIHIISMNQGKVRGIELKQEVVAEQTRRIYLSKELLNKFVSVIRGWGAV